MAGHSKWANIQHRKKAQDAKRGKIFTRLVREITVAAREGGGDPDTNPRLRLAWDKANAANVPKDNIERAIKKATGDLEGAQYEEITYEGYAPGGVAVMVDTVTDNRNRTVAEVRHAFSKHGGNLGQDGSVAFLFEKKGVISFGPDASEDAVMEAALEAGAEDIATHDDGSIEVLTAPEEFSGVLDAIKAAGLEPDEAEVTQRPASEVEQDLDSGRKLLKFLDMLEDLDDTQHVWHNADIPARAYES
jgi:YebC/PmpR family DNA-binding regulatory protein